MNCQSSLCGACVTITKVGKHEIPVCPMCGGPVQEIATAGPAKASFWEYLITALPYPLSGKGVLLIVLNGLFVGICLVVGVFALLVGIFVRLFAVGYVYWLLFKVVQQNALEKDQPPSMPELNSLGEVFGVLFKVLVLFAVWTAPAVIVAHVTEGTPQLFFEVLGMALAGPFTLWAFVIDPGHLLAVRVVAGIGIFFIPMSLLAVATFNSLRGVNPIPLVLTMAQAPLQYLACCVSFYAATAAILAIWGLVATQTGVGIAILLFPMALVYCAFAVGRILGGLHAANRERFGWVRT